MVIPIHESSSNVPISRGENENGTQTPLGLDAHRKRMRTVTRTGVKANKYFYIREIRCQAEPGSFATALVRSRAVGNGCKGKAALQ